MIGVRSLGHVNLRAGATMVERLRRFYTDIIGLDEGPRPGFRSGSHGHCGPMQPFKYVLADY